jgi:type VI secretion system secreted protein Hcp
MAIEMFLDIPGITGEALTKGFEGKIEIHSFSLGASNPTGVSSGSGSGAGKVSFSSLSVQKTVDKATPPLFLSCCSGKHYATGKLTIREAGGDAQVEYMVIDTTQIFAESISWGGSEGGDKPSESIAFSFATIKVTYTPQDATGAAMTAIPAGWDAQKNAKL